MDALKSFGNFRGKRLSWCFFLKNLQAEALQLYQKSLQHWFFSLKFCEIFKNTLFNTLVITLWWLLLYIRWLLLYSFKKVWRTNNFFFSTRHLMYKNSNSFVYKFVVNCQIFEITTSGCTLRSWKLACLITWTILFETPFFKYLSMRL